MNKSNLMAIGVVVCILAACGSGSSDDVDIVAASMMTGTDPLSEKDAQCMAKNMKKLASDDQWDLLIKVQGGEMSETDMSMDQAMSMMMPTMAAAKECEVELF